MVAHTRRSKFLSGQWDGIFIFYVHKKPSCTISDCRFCGTKIYLALPLFSSSLRGGGRGLSVDGHEQGSRFSGTLAPSERGTEGSLDFTFYHKNKHPKSKIQCACSERMACGGERRGSGYLHIMRLWDGVLSVP